MVPERGLTSNGSNSLLAEWNAKDKSADTGIETAFTPETLEDLFTTLAEWNEYLENGVPYYAENPVEGGPK